MKFKLIIDKEREEELIIYSHNKDKFTDEIEALCKSRSCDLVGYKEKEAVILDLLEVNCFTVEDNKVFAITDKSISSSNFLFLASTLSIASLPKISG